MEQIQTVKDMITVKSVPNRSKAKILVIDDDMNILRTLRDILVGTGYDVETVQSGKKALDLLGSGSNFDLIITDMKMPEMDGLEFLGKSRPLKRAFLWSY